MRPLRYRTLVWVIVTTLSVSVIRPAQIVTAQVTIPDLIMLEFVTQPNVLGADVQSQTATIGSGVSGIFELSNPFNELFLPVDVAASESGLITPIGALDTFWNDIGFIAPGGVIRYSVKFSSTSQTTRIDSNLISKRSIAVNIFVQALKIVPGVRALDQSKIIQAIGDLADLEQKLEAFIDLTEARKLITEPLSWQTPARVITFADGLKEFLDSPTGRSYVISVLQRLGLNADDSLLDRVFNWVAVLSVLKLVADSLVYLGMSLWARNFTNTYQLRPVTYNSANRPPFAPRLIAPLDTNLQQPIRFEWGRVVNATSYGLQVDTTTDFSSPDLDVTTTDTFLVSSIRFASNTTYYWRVQSRNGVGVNTSSVGTFRTGPISYDSPPQIHPGDQAVFISDVTLPDGIRVEPLSPSFKTWRLRNTGTVTWDANVKLAFRRGKQMGAPNEVGVPNTAPGATADISVNLTTPAEPGEHVGYWQLKRDSTFFGPELKVQINVRGDALPPNSPTSITAFDISPASPSAASSVRLVGRVRRFADFRAMRFVVGNERFEMSNFKVVGDQFEISADWNTAGLARGTYTVALEVARVGDTNWSQPIRQVKSYSLIGSPAPANRPPSRPVLKSPYNWFLRDASGASAAVTLCVEPTSDPEGNEVRYIFQVNNGQITTDYSTQPCWTHTYAPGNYTWRAKTRDSNGAESDWSVEMWNFSVANGGVSIGAPYERVLDPGQTQLCVEVNYSGIQAPQVKGFINTATDGSESGEWRQLDHFGPNAEQCNAPNVHGFRLYPVSYATGLHAIKISAHKLDSGASAQRMTSFNVPFMRPAGPQGIAPSTLSNNGTQWNTRTILFDWEPALRAESYTLRVSTTPDPFGDPSPVLNVTLDPNTTDYTHTFSQDYATLYWSVRASNGAGTGDSAIASFGIDLVQPNCTLQPLPAVHYDAVATINWVGSDNASGVRSFDVQVRDSQRGDWLDWLVDSEAAVAQFLGQPGLSYEFRCRARDRAGNVGTFPANAQASTKLDPTARPPEPWWNGAFAGKRNISILNTMPGSSLPAGYPVVYRASGATAAEIYNSSLSAPKCNDLRVVYNNRTELDRLVTKCTVSEIEIWFRKPGQYCTRRNE